MAAELERQAAAAATASDAVEPEPEQVVPDASLEHRDPPGNDGLDEPHLATYGKAPARRKTLHINSFYTATPQNRHASHISSSEQLNILREAYARNPFPTQKELEVLGEKTGRPWRKVREYYRQRRNKGRGIGELEALDEPGRATGWSVCPDASGSIVRADAAGCK